MLKLKQNLQQYIATPWDPNQHTLIQPKEYYSILDELNLNVNQKCNVNQENQGVVCQSHGGDLYEHSKWAELQVVRWFEENNELTEGLDLETARVCAFFHDIGKGGDCIKDMYSPEKYNGKGEKQHPIDSGNIILGKKEYNFCDGTTVRINDFINSNFPMVSIRVVALTAFMHWEFGKLNIPGVDPSETDPVKLTNLNEKIKIYIQTFKKFCEICDLSPNEKYLKYCILIACADISAGSNIRLQGLKGVPKQKYISKDPWTAFKMDQRYLFYKRKVLEAFKGKSSFGKTQSDYNYLKNLKCS